VRFRGLGKQKPTRGKRARIRRKRYRTLKGGGLWTPDLWQCGRECRNSREVGAAILSAPAARDALRERLRRLCGRALGRRSDPGLTPGGDVPASNRAARPGPCRAPRGRAMPAASEGSRGGLRRDHGRSRNVILSSRCRDVTRGHDPGSARHRPPGSRASVRDWIRGGARASVLWRSAAARPSATVTRAGARYPEPSQRGWDTTEPQEHAGISRYGNVGPVLSSPWPAVPPVVRIPAAGRCQGGAEMARTKPICWAIQVPMRLPLKW
jgi:hypothetical protein